MSETAKWYVIHTYSGYENKVAQDIEKVVENRKLHDMILEVRVPTEKVTEITDGKIREVERKTFPSYVLLKMIYTDDTWHVVKNIRGVTGFVGPGSEPTPLSEQEVQALGVHTVRMASAGAMRPWMICCYLSKTRFRLALSMQRESASQAAATAVT